MAKARSGAVKAQTVESAQKSHKSPMRAHRAERNAESLPSTARAGAPHERATKGKTVVFSLIHPGASRVFVAGDWSGWDPLSSPMELGESAGAFRLELHLPPGRHEYKFIVDGAWREDTENPNRVPDGCGGFNSVLRIEV